jgi:hypothetical protein
MAEYHGAEGAALDDVDDPGEYNQRRRLRALGDARERVFAQRRHALDEYALGNISALMRDTIVREAVESLILEIEQLVVGDHFMDDQLAEALPNGATRSEVSPTAARYSDREDEWGGEWFWHEAPLGSVTRPDTGAEVPIQGLRGFLEFPNPMVVSWEEDLDPPAGFSTHPKGETDTRTEQVQLPEWVSMTAYRVAAAFLNQVGLDARLEDELPTFGFVELDDDELDALDETGPDGQYDGVVVDGR